MFPSERAVQPFIDIIEDKVMRKTGKNFSLTHWKKYRNTERGQIKKAAVFESILEAVAEDKTVTLWAFIEKENTIVTRQRQYLNIFGLTPFVTINESSYTFGPFFLVHEKDGLKSKKQITSTVPIKSGGAIVWCAICILRVFKSWDAAFTSRHPGKQMKLDLRVDLLPYDDINKLERLSGFMGLLLNGSDQRISPKVNPGNKNHMSDILADNIAGMIGEWSEFSDGKWFEEYPQEQGIIHYKIT